MISGILLSAGLSARFGSPKALAPLTANTTVIEHVQQTLIDSSLDEVVIVLGAMVEQIKPRVLNHKKIKVVYNKDYNFGQTSSFKVGLKAISPHAKAFALLPVDYPVVQKSTIDDVVTDFENQKALIVIPTYQGQKGHPPIFSFRLFPEFMLLDNTLGINTIIHKHTNEVRLLPLNDPGITATFNTPAEFETLKQQFKI